MNAQENSEAVQEESKPTRLPIFLSALVFPGVGQFLQKRTFAGIIYMVGCLASEGRLLSIGFASGSWVQADPGELALKNASLIGVFVGAYNPGQRLEVHTELLRFYRRGLVKPVLDRVVDFEDIPSALTDLAAQRVSGKLVVRVGG